MAKQKIKWTSEKIMSTSALFISVISLIALLYQSYLAREENKMNQKQLSASVFPHLSQWFNNSNGNYKIIIGNKGVGPAFVRKVNISIEDEHKFENTDDFFAHIFKSDSRFDSINVLTSTFKKGYVLPANETIELISLSDRKCINKLNQVLASKGLSFSIEYEDVYGTRWRISNADDYDEPLLLIKD